MLRREAGLSLEVKVVFVVSLGVLGLFCMYRLSPAPGLVCGRGWFCLYVCIDAPLFSWAWILVSHLWPHTPHFL